MNTQTHFTTCNGNIVRLSAVSFAPAGQGGAVVPEKNVPVVMAFGGGRPPLFHYAMGRCESCGQWHFAERMIERPSNASNHACSGKCRNATGHNCECSCGGANHGAN